MGELGDLWHTRRTGVVQADRDVIFGTIDRPPVRPANPTVRVAIPCFPTRMGCVPAVTAASSVATARRPA